MPRMPLARPSSTFDTNICGLMISILQMLVPYIRTNETCCVSTCPLARPEVQPMAHLCEHVLQRVAALVEQRLHLAEGHQAGLAADGRGLVAHLKRPYDHGRLMPAASSEQTKELPDCRSVCLL